MFWFCRLHAVILVWSINSLVTTSSNNDSDRLALLAFKGMIDEDPLGVVSSWNDSLHYCEWHGVTCSSRHHQRVTVLDLQLKNLGGTLSSHIGNLTFLQLLRLNNNNFHGPVPQQVGRLFRLRYLYLGTNLFSGELPVNLTHFPNLQIFSLDHNRLSGTILLPLDITLPHLQELHLNVNKFVGPIPSSLRNLSSLSLLTLAFNNLEGNIPDDLCENRNLYSLDVGSNILVGQVPVCLYNLSTLTTFSIDGNHLVGDIPADIGVTLPNLQRLYLGGNKFTGPIPISLSNASSLGQIWLEVNHFTGSIPRDLGRLQNLRVLSLYTNQLGTIHGDDLAFITSLTNCSTLDQLIIANNSLTGSIPNSIANLSTQITHLYFEINQIYGSFPTGIINLVNLSYLGLSYNHLSGNIPTVIGRLPGIHFLVTLDVSRNTFSGNLPDALGKCFALVYLYMEGNFFQGIIPQSLSTLRGLKEFDLSQNKLSGPIPKYLINSTLLSYLNFSYNELEGPVPTDGVFANASVISVVGNSKLCGGVVELKLSPCHIKGMGKSLALKVIILVIVGSSISVLALCFLLMLYGRSLSVKNASSPSLFDNQYPKISYADLLKATDCFSADKLIGTGSYGSVYKGILDSINKTVAVKVFNLQLQGASKSFLAECNAMRNLRHRNLLKIITSCSGIDYQGNDFKALVFEFMPRGSLEEWLHPKEERQLKNLNLLQRLNIAIDIASALEYLHHHSQPPIFHCDLKPSNVLLDDDMTSHVADFGLAKIFTAAHPNCSQSQGSSLAIKGSIGYVAPEYGMGSEVSMEGDVYSYGILLLEMFTGRRPTDDTFQNGLSIHSFAKTALPGQVMSILDPTLPLEKSLEDVNIERGAIHDCLVSLIWLGVGCSSESPMERMNMGEVLTELYHIKDHHQGVGVFLGIT